MGDKMKLNFFKSILILSLLVFNQAKADPDENLRQTLTRGVGQNLLETDLTKNFYRTEPYQDVYPIEVPYQEDETYYVDVPYQEDETYYVDVPYQDQESYEDTEVYYDQDYVCHTEYENECHYEQVCHSEYERQCHDERQCYNTPGNRDCQEVEECGTNAHGERICKTRKVCNDVPGREECRDVPKCENVPHQVCNNQDVCNQVPHERCGYESVQKTRTVTKWRTVTKYRQEARTRTVTKYRQEARTRTVTKYRTEYKCCKTYFRQVFDHQDKVHAIISIPSNAILENNETEKMDIELLDGGSNPQINLDFTDTIYGYKVAKLLPTLGQVKIDLELVPKYKASELSEATINNIKMTTSKEGTKLSWIDEGIRKKIKTSYKYQVKEKSSGIVIEEKALQSENKKNVEVKLEKQISLTEDYLVTLQVYREGVVLDKPVNFTKQAEHLFDRLNSEDFGKDKVKNMNVIERTMALYFSFQDLGFDDRLVTQYVLTVLSQSDQKTIFEKNTYAKDVLDVSTKNVKIEMPLDKFSDKEKYKISLQVYRTSKLLDREVNFILEQDYDRTLDKAMYADVSKVGGLVLKIQDQSKTIEFFDKALVNPAVQNKYTITLVGPGGFLGLKRVTFLSKTLKDSEIKFKDAKATLNITQDLGLDQSKAEKYFKGGNTIDVILKVERVSSRLNEGKSIVITKQIKQKIAKSESPWDN